MPVKYSIIVQADPYRSLPAITKRRIKELRLVHTQKKHAYSAGSVMAQLPGVEKVCIFRVERKCVMEFK